MKQPEGLHDKPLVIEEEVTLTGGIQGNSPAWLLLGVEGSTVSSHLSRSQNKRRRNVKEKSLGDHLYTHRYQVPSLTSGLSCPSSGLWSLVGSSSCTITEEMNVKLEKHLESATHKHTHTVYITLIFGRSVVKVLPESKTSPKCNHLFFGPLSTSPENFLQNNFCYFRHIASMKVITDLIFH